MAYDDESERQSRVVVDTPTQRREFVESHSVRDPDRSSISAGTVGVIVVVAIALITMLVLFWMSNQNRMDQNANLAAQQPPPTTVVQQPAAQQPPVIIQQPAPATQQAPIIVTPPSGGSVASAPNSSAPVNDDMNVQAAIDKRLTDDPALSSLGVTATVINGKVTLLGTVKTEALKAQVEQAVRRIKGVKDLDNQITVVSE